MRTLGYIFIFLGLLLLLKEFQPAVLEPLRAYASYIKNAFWGVTLLALGLYMLTRRTLRKAVLVLYIIYLILYLVV
ncbi:hypothetical protein [Thermococcus peptonophilus]|uniref:Uncharacterized protein n=1 Tax=Thermococcus peptonophilus TaxID=53952 RepID=A0A142CTZ1_9EURY|nr:hypothetical protein [Thermococcus peptonophilus]AMQ18243.1 hypothetical protein A0127_03195 [Thermococcus peptonophilus]